MSLPLDAPDQEEEEHGARGPRGGAGDRGGPRAWRVIARVVRARSLAQADPRRGRGHDADLILLGSAPRWRSQSRFFSPTVDEVLRRSPIEVMVVAYPEGVLADEEGG